LLDSLGKATHLDQGGEIRRQKFRGAASFLDLGDEALASLPVAAMHQHARTGFAKPLRDQATDAIRRAGDQRGLAVQSRHAEAPVAHPGVQHGATRSRNQFYLFRQGVLILFRRSGIRTPKRHDQKPLRLLLPHRPAARSSASFKRRVHGIRS
jgi:hypothetical protein